MTKMNRALLGMFLLAVSFSAGIPDARGDSCVYVAPCGFLYSGGLLTTFNVPGAIWTEAYGINNAGQIVGAYASGSGLNGFVDTGGVFATIDAPGASLTELYGIDDSGQIVGLSSYGAFLYSGGTFTYLSSEPYFFSIHISGNGQIVLDNLGGEVDLISGGNWTFLGYPGWALGINDSGQVLYNSFSACGGYGMGINDLGQVVGNFPGGGFVYSDGTCTSLNIPWNPLTSAYGINDSGQIVGAYGPEPGTLALLATGMIGLVGMLRRVSFRSH